MKQKLYNTVTFVVLIMFLLIITACIGQNELRRYTGLVEGNVYAVSVPISEKLISLSVREGDLVNKGTELGEIDTESLELQLKGLIAKRTQIELQMKELDLNSAQVRDTRDHYLETYNKNLELLKVDAVSDQTVQDLKLNLDKWERDLKGLSIKRETLHQQEEELVYKLDEMKLMIAKGILTSPSDGYVDKIYYSKGEYVPAMRPIFQLVNLSKVWCYIYMGESAIAELSPGEELQAVSGDTILTARVEHINSRAEFTPKEVLTPENREALVYGVRVGIENPEGILKIGMPVDIIWE